MHAKKALLALLFWLPPSSSRAGSAQAEVGTDLLRSTSRVEDPPAGVPAELKSNELGFRLRGDLYESIGEDLLGVHVDYRAREPFWGNLRNSTVRILYRCEVTYEGDRLSLGIGRFLAPSVVLLPIDGANLTVKLFPSLKLTLFGGRRGVSTSRRNIDFGKLLPAFGGSASFTRGDLDVEVGGAWAKDELVLFNGGQERTDDFGGASGFARALWHLDRELFVGVNAAFLEQAAYVIGPTWTELEIVAEALGFWSGSIFLLWYPIPELRLGADLHHQSASAIRSGTRHQLGDGSFVAKEAAPRFWEGRLRAGWQFLGSRAEVELRARARTSWTELRYRIAVTAGGKSFWPDVPVVSGLYAHAALIYDDLIGAEEELYGDPDRLWFDATTGWRSGPYEVALGIRVLEREAPLSGRAFAPPSPGESSELDDLSPFVLEAQQIGFIRAFYSGPQWFGGVDFERNLRDAEYRVLVQAGAFWEDSW